MEDQKQCLLREGAPNELHFDQRGWPEKISHVEAYSQKHRKLLLLYLAVLHLLLIVLATCLVVWKEHNGVGSEFYCEWFGF
jgi:hypothetical protein